MQKLFAIFMLGLLFALTGCTGGGEKTQAEHSASGADFTFTHSGDGPIEVLTTTGMINDIVQNIGGRQVKTEALMGPGIDPHLYKATPGDVRKLTEADMIFFNGLHLEGKMVEILERMQDKKPSVAVAVRIPEKELLQADGTTDAPDPHVWFDVQKWILASEAVRDALKKFDAPNAAKYEANATKYLAELRKLDGYAKKQLVSIPKPQRVLVTAHDAFRYFGQAYDVEVRGLQGISTASEVSLRDVQRTVELLVSRKVKAIFVESSVPRRQVEAVVQGCKAKGHTVTIGGSLYSDAMGPEGTPSGTYAGMVRHNVDTIVKALK